MSWRRLCSLPLGALGGPEGNGVVNTVTGVHVVIYIFVVTKLGDLRAHWLVTSWMDEEI
jgi:hypothetical protein